ncbi:hypothetical protein D9Q98_006679 [Chlorella vulgaris]|uniref:SGNH hydrolase-type esterase domain-containing protein n=1 Tax=Chlorella vulgaris TaxID=3077 RepID=A0A9D4TLI0_CHLVU|nr:hypothetical protein D9Q98_006679 [Chlorella vulgaris]
MTEAQDGLKGPLAAAASRPALRKPLVSQAQLVCVCVIVGVGALITGAPALLGPGSLRCRTSTLKWPAPSMPVARPSALPKRLQLPWPPFLSKEELRRGETYFGSGRRLNKVAKKLLAGKPIKVFALGGSITGGGGATIPKLGYVERFFSFIQAAFPHEEHVMVNKAIAASTAFLYATCLQHHVPQDVDLVTLEFSANERADAPFTSLERRSFEQLIRRLLQYPGRPAILLLHHYAWWEAPGDGVDRGLFYRQPEGQLTEMAHYYDIPTVSIRAAAYHLMAAGVDKFRVDAVPMAGRAHAFLLPNGSRVVGVIPSSPPNTPWEPFFLVDGMHPGNFGHQALAELLAQPLIRAVWEAEAGEAVYVADRRPEPRVAGLPPPMIPGNQDSTPGFCAMLEAFKPVVRNVSGFEYQAERPDAADFMHQKWGWRATEPGSWAELELDTRADDGAGADTVVWLAYLRSYQGMGTALISCVSGCTCEPAVLDGTWQRRASLFWMTRFPVSRTRRCRIRVTVQEAAGEFPQKGHKVMLVAVMVAHLDLAHSGTLVNVQELQNVRRRRKKKRRRLRKRQ